MSISVGTGMAIAGGAAALGTGAGIMANSNLNKKNRKWQEKMYAQQLADERENWNMQNQYNEEMYNKYQSPLAQSQQMMAAGINPDLQDISVGSVPQAGDVGSSSVPSVSGQERYDFVGAFMNIAEMLQGLRSRSLDNELKQAEIDKISKSYAMDYLVKSYNPSYDDSPLVGMSDIMNDSIRASRSSGSLATYFRKQGLSRRAANLAARFVQTTNVDDVRLEYYNSKHGSESSRKSFLSDIADPLYNSDDGDMIKQLNDFLSRKSDLDKFIDRAAKAKASFEGDYYNARDGRSVASSESEAAGYRNRILKNQADSSENVAEVDRSFEQWVSKIDSPFGQVLCRLLYRMLSNFHVNKGGFSI